MLQHSRCQGLERLREGRAGSAGEPGDIYINGEGGIGAVSLKGQEGPPLWISLTVANEGW